MSLLLFGIGILMGCAHVVGHSSSDQLYLPMMAIFLCSIPFGFLNQLLIEFGNLPVARLWPSPLRGFGLLLVSATGLLVALLALLTYGSLPLPELILTGMVFSVAGFYAQYMIIPYFALVLIQWQMPSLLSSHVTVASLVLAAVVVCGVVGIVLRIQRHWKHDYQVHHVPGMPRPTRTERKSGVGTGWKHGTMTLDSGGVARALLFEAHHHRRLAGHWAIHVSLLFLVVLLLIGGLMYVIGNAPLDSAAFELLLLLAIVMVAGIFSHVSVVRPPQHRLLPIPRKLYARAIRRVHLQRLVQFSALLAGLSLIAAWLLVRLFGMARGPGIAACLMAAFAACAPAIAIAQSLALRYDGPTLSNLLANTHWQASFTGSLLRILLLLGIMSIMLVATTLALRGGLMALGVTAAVVCAAECLSAWDIHRHCQYRDLSRA